MLLRHPWILLIVCLIESVNSASVPLPANGLVARHGNDEHGHQEHAMDSESTGGPAHDHMLGTHHSAPKEFDASVLDGEPLSYFSHDLQDDGHGALMTCHVLLMATSWTGCLPLSLYLRAAKHPLYHVAQLGFLVTLILGILTARIYKAATPDLYPGNKHTSMGWFAVLLAGGLFAIDTIQVIRNLKTWLADGAQLSLLGRVFRKSEDSESKVAYEMVSSPAMVDEDEVEDLQQSPLGAQPRRGHRAEMSSTYASPVSPFGSMSEGSSRDSNDTLHENERHIHWQSSHYLSDSDRPKKRLSSLLSTAALNLDRDSKLQMFFKYFHIFLLRSLVPLGYACVILGIVEYSGKCRAWHINGCLAHLIKGSIFLGWGLLSFARYLGAWSELGWSWNKKPDSNSWRRSAPSAEFVECFLIFFYGATNTFMERFGAKKGDPFSIHQIQHISIAILFFGAGLLGLALESKTLRSMLSNGIRSSLPEQAGITNRIPDPPSYSTSFNPIPALVAALTGLAMSAHHQEYAFAVKVHQLWGYQLVLFGVCRILTYTFLWLRPPASTLPSRPPTEALASFFCATGGVVFMLSTEEAVWSFMANGLDDVMTINNLALAAVGCLFAWQAALHAFKGWAATRMFLRRN